ncbi:hypothetical protein GDO86_014802 [Hymenochirus boettgeri]|uniref:Uncharacterized protein n=1 Tax=Hymenochirus boettgeri TaxID=247094 RepID=A0A8T2JYF8_9PIPI|nr:hypothetical protein GDO86_014802 [Hymenochirus boettgeri]
MSNTEDKHYHDEEFDPCCLCETYAGYDRLYNEDAMEEIMENVYKVLSSGCVKGDTIIDVSLGLYMFQLFIAADYFKNIILIESSDSCVDEIQKWINNEPGAVDKSHMAAFACALKGKSEGWQKQEEKARQAIKQVVKWDLTKENPLEDVVLPKADCLISCWYLELVSKDPEMYLSLQKHFSSLLKIGSHLILMSLFNMSYYTIGDHKFSSLRCNEEFVQKVLTDCGYVIESFEKHKSKLNSNLIDYDYYGCFVCRKEKEV